MNLRFYIDSETSLPHIYNHQMRRPGEDRSGSHDSRIAIGQTQAGRYIRVIYVSDPEPDSFFIVTAYELRGKPLNAYRRRKGRKS